jgi:hypothetical protein
MQEFICFVARNLCPLSTSYTYAAGNCCPDQFFLSYCCRDTWQGKSSIEPQDHEELGFF